MSKNYSRVQRGMVFWFNPDKVYKEQMEFESPKGKRYKTSIQHGNRPWLVVSNNEGNNSARTCNVIPITTEQNKTEIPVHVRFEFEGIPQLILVEQPRTVDIAALGEYMCTVSDEVMEQVEKAQAIQFAIRPSITYLDITLDKVTDYLRNLVSYILQEKQVLIERQESLTINGGGAVPMSNIEDAALQLGEMIEDLVGVSKPEKPVEAPKPQPAHGSQIEKFNQRLAKSQQIKQQEQPKTQPTAVVEENTTQKRKRNSWTEESRKAYLVDCEKMTPQEIMVKYNFKSVQSVFQTKYACKNALGIN